MILRKHLAWPEKNRIFALVLCTIQRQSLIFRSRQRRAASHPQSCSAVPNSATAPMDRSKENAQWDDAARNAVNQTNLSALLGINQSQFQLPGFRMAGTTASALGHAGASRENLSTVGRRCHSIRLLLQSDLNHRPRSRWKRPATAMTLCSGATTLSRPKWWTRRIKCVCWQGYEIRYGMCAGSGAGRRRRICVGFFVAVKLFQYFFEEAATIPPQLPHRGHWSQQSYPSSCCVVRQEAEYVQYPSTRYLSHRKATGYT